MVTYPPLLASNFEELDLLNPSLNEQCLTLFDPTSSISRHLEIRQTIEERLLIDFLVSLDNKFLTQFSKRHMDKMMYCIKTNQRYPNDVIWTNTVAHARKMISFVTSTDKFIQLPLNDQFALLPKINKQLAFITYASYATPMRKTPSWETKLQLKTQQTEFTKATSMDLKQIMFPREWYTSQDHQDQVTDLVQRMTLLSFDQTSFLLTYLMAFFRGQNFEDSASISEAHDFFQNLLYNHLKNKMGKAFAAPMMERHVEAITDLDNVPELNFPTKIN